MLHLAGAASQDRSGIGFGEKNLAVAGRIGHGGGGSCSGPEGGGNERTRNETMVMREAEAGSILRPKDLVQVLAFAYDPPGDLAKSFNFQSRCSCGYNDYDHNVLDSFDL